MDRKPFVSYVRVRTALVSGLTVGVGLASVATFHETEPLGVIEPSYIVSEVQAVPHDHTHQDDAQEISLVGRAAIEWVSSGAMMNRASLTGFDWSRHAGSTSFDLD